MNYVKFVCSIFLLHLVIISATYIPSSLSPHVYMPVHFIIGLTSILYNITNATA